jgi:Sporulation and spore germination
MRKFRVALGLFLGAVLLSSCSLIPQSKGPVTVAKDKVPFGLLDQNIPGTNTSVKFTQTPVYLVHAGRLVVSRRVVTSPVQVVDALNQLLLPVSGKESSTHLGSEIPRGLQILQVSVLNGVARVNLAASISAFNLLENPVAVGQVVLTAQAAGARNGVVFAIEGVSQDAMVPSGKTAPHVFAYQYSRLVN